MFEAAASWNATEVARLAAADRALVTATDPRGRTPLHLACAVDLGGSNKDARAAIATVDALLKAGADLETVNPIKDGDDVFPATPLWYAVARGVNLPLVKHLLKRGARADQCLWAVVWRDDAEMLKALLASRPKLNLVAEGETPIFYAARLQRLRTLDLLLKAGADPGVRCLKGDNAVEIAKKRRLPEPFIARLEQAVRR